MPIARWIQRLAVLCLLMLGVARTQAGIVNGDFELGPDAGRATGWTDEDTYYGHNRCSLNSCPNGRSNYISSGNFWIWFGGASQSQHGYIQQAAVIEAGTTTLSFDFWAWETDNDLANMRLFVDTTEIWQVTSSNAAQYSSGYSTQNFSISKWADGEQHHFTWQYGDGVAGLGTNWFLDNVRLDTPLAGNVPEPGTLMLSGMAGLALVATRRRQGPLS